MTPTPKPPSTKDHGLPAQIESSESANVDSMKERGPSEEMLKKASEILETIVLINQHNGYQWTQPVMYTRQKIAKALAEQQATHDKLYMAACDRVRELGGQVAELSEHLKLARGCLEFVQEKTETDPAEGPELRARAAVVNQLARECLLQIGGKDG